MHSDWFNEIEILQGRWQHGEKVGYSYPSGLDKTLCKWEMYVPLVAKGLNGCLKLCFIYTVVVPHVLFYDNVRNSPHSQFTVIFNFIIPLMLMFLATVSLWDISL
jgi:hypothetical protein